MTPPSPTNLDPAQTQHLRKLLESGLPRCTRPYLELSRTIGAQESDVIWQVQRWQQAGLFRRFGLVIHHRRLGISANVMLVLDVPDESVQHLGQQLADEPDVTLCYQRRRQLPEWPYNLFCMVHGRDRTEVTQNVTAMLSRLNLNTFPHQMLFSLRAFKQRGARFSAQHEHEPRRPAHQLTESIHHE